ncbi:MAG TPA: hypothetical protein VJV78_37955 [Polyangiales bacterium]|nr:hypothetical protein [Polyangiales bacterium]
MLRLGPRPALSLLGLSLVLLLQRPSHAAAQAGAYIPTSADLLLQGRPAEGLLILRSGYRNSPYVDVDALVFVGATTEAWEGDVLAVSVLIREPHGFGQARLGRFIVGTGAVGPVQIDGAELVLRAFSGSHLSVFAGLPVMPEFGPRDYDWLVGGRVGQQLISDRLGLGISYLHRRDQGQLDAEELGADAALEATSWLSFNAIGAWSLIADGLAELRGAALLHDDGWQVELFGVRRVAARLLPATSLFSVIGAAASSSGGAEVSWRAFPRLQFGGTLALEGLDDELGYRAALRSTLSLTDSGPGQIGVEVIRRKLADEGFIGGAIRAQVPIAEVVQANASAELVAADDPRERGKLWPWLRLGASWTPSARWLVAAAVGLRATPEYERDIYAMLRIGYQAQLQP